MLKAILFDMDGTLTQPLIDWPRVRARLGVPDGATIMDHIESQEGDQRARAESLLESVEYEAATNARPNEGAGELLELLREQGLKTALVTNNHRRAMLCIVDRLGLQFDLLLSREDGTAKPAPDLLQLALVRLGVEPEETLFVGDGRYDRAASAAAAIRYVHLDHEQAEEQSGLNIHALPALRQLVSALVPM